MFVYSFDNGIRNFATEKNIHIVGANVALKMIFYICLLYTSDAADERSSVDLGGRRIIKNTHSYETTSSHTLH